MPVHEIRENGEGRFHLQNFGRQVCGQDGSSCFTLIVRDSMNNEIARIEDLTAADMNIGSEGRHFNESTYRVTDFFVWGPDRTLKVTTQSRQALVNRLVYSGNQVGLNSQVVPSNATTRSRSRTRNQRAEWPLWRLPSDDEIKRSLADITPFIRFIHPTVIERVVSHNSAIESYVQTMEAQGIRMASYYWDGAPTLFPGVRRFVGGTDSDFKLQPVPLEFRAKKQATYLDDNSYPKQLWSFMIRGKRFNGSNPRGYELAHLFHHKLETATPIEDELSGELELLLPVSAFFTSACACAFVPKSLARVTDLSLLARKVLQRKVLEMYGSICNPLPPAVTLRNEDSDWSPAEFTWAEPVGSLAENSTGIDSFLDFRQRELERMALFLEEKAS